MQEQMTSSMCGPLRGPSVTWILRVMGRQIILPTRREDHAFNNDLPTASSFHFTWNERRRFWLALLCESGFKEARLLSLQSFFSSFDEDFFVASQIYTCLGNHSAIWQRSQWPATPHAWGKGNHMGCVHLFVQRGRLSFKFATSWADYT